MRHILFSIASIFTVTTSAFADIELKELVFGNPVKGTERSAIEASRAAHKLACDSWKAATEADAGANVKYASCGVSKETSVGEWQEEEREYCRVVPEVYCEWRKVKILYPGGFKSESEGLVLVGFDGPTSALEERITTDVVTQNSSNIETERLLISAIQRACTAWKVDARKRLGERMLAASCSDKRRLPQRVNDGLKIKVEMLGLILIKR